MGLLFAQNFAALGGNVVLCDVRDYCVCVSPGPVLTREAMANMKTLLGRAADPQEIVDLCLFIAS